MASPRYIEFNASLIEFFVKQWNNPKNERDKDEALIRLRGYINGNDSNSFKGHLKGVISQNKNLSPADKEELLKLVNKVSFTAEGLEILRDSFKRMANGDKLLDDLKIIAQTAQGLSATPGTPHATPTHGPKDKVREMKNFVADATRQQLRNFVASGNQTPSNATVAGAGAGAGSGSLAGSAAEDEKARLRAENEILRQRKQTQDAQDARIAELKAQIAAVDAKSVGALTSGGVSQFGHRRGAGESPKGIYDDLNEEFKTQLKGCLVNLDDFAKKSPQERGAYIYANKDNAMLKKVLERKPHEAKVFLERSVGEACWERDMKYIDLFKESSAFKNFFQPVVVSGPRGAS